MRRETFRHKTVRHKTFSVKLRDLCGSVLKKKTIQHRGTKHTEVHRDFFYGLTVLRSYDLTVLIKSVSSVFPIIKKVVPLHL